MNRGHVLFTALLAIGLLFPTSVAGSISRTLDWLGILLSFSLICMLAWKCGISERRLLYIGIPIPLLLAGFTFLSPLHLLATGALPAFVTVALIYCINLENYRMEHPEWILALASIVMLIFGFGVLLGSEGIGAFMNSHYSYFFQDLMQIEIGAHEPVITFATHSLAGVFLYLFFWLNFRTYQTRSKSLHLWLALALLFLCLAVRSHTGLAFGLLGIAQIVYWLWIRRHRAITVATIALILYLVPIGAHYWFDWVKNWGDVRDMMSGLWLGQGTGFRGRYGAEGNLYDTITFIREHPLRPTGLTVSDNFFMGDSGPVEYWLRGSLPFFVLMYGGLWVFLWRSFHIRSDCYVLFFVILLAETGFGVLHYTRSLCLIPAFVMYLNSISPERETVMNREPLTG